MPRATSAWGSLFEPDVAEALPAVVLVPSEPFERNRRATAAKADAPAVTRSRVITVNGAREEEQSRSCTVALGKVELHRAPALPICRVKPVMSTRPGRSSGSGDSTRRPANSQVPVAAPTHRRLRRGWSETDHPERPSVPSPFRNAWSSSNAGGTATAVTSRSPWSSWAAWWLPFANPCAAAFRPVRASAMF